MSPSTPNANFTSRKLSVVSLIFFKNHQNHVFQFFSFSFQNKTQPGKVGEKNTETIFKCVLNWSQLRNVAYSTHMKITYTQTNFCFNFKIINLRLIHSFGNNFEVFRKWYCNISLSFEIGALFVDRKLENEYTKN